MLQPGRYWVGDPCYVLDGGNGWDWQKLLDQTNYFGLMDNEGNCRPRWAQAGEFELKGMRMAASPTLYGDGCYETDNLNGRRLGVDAGLIACIPEEMLPNGEGTDLGEFVVIREPFTVFFSEKGVIQFGPVKVYTGGIEEDTEEDEYFSNPWY